VAGLFIIFIDPMNKPLFSLFFLLIVMPACKKKDEPVPEPQTGSMTLEFDNRVDDKTLVLDDWYLNARGDSFQVSKFNYYISNVVLRNHDGSVFAVPESYRIIKHPSARTMSLDNIPAGNYAGIQFMIGVDSTRNVSGAQSGGLDVGYASDMYWSWTTGYIFLKLEGKSPRSGAPSKAITYHIGGYGGPEKTQRVFNIDFSSEAVVDGSRVPRIVLRTNVNELFRTPNLLDVQTVYSQSSPGAGAKAIADNYADMITFGSVQNQ
jgi:hypothetical protein